MGMKTPQILQGANVIVDGFGHLGVTDECKLPVVEFNSVTSDSGGVTREISTGTLKAMTASIKLKECNFEVALAMHRQSQNGAVVFIRGNTVQNGQKKPIVATLKGYIRKAEDSALKMNEELVRDLEMSVSTYILLIDGKPHFTIDTENMVALIGGVDVLADMRANIQG